MSIREYTDSQCTVLRPAPNDYYAAIKSTNVPAPTGFAGFWEMDGISAYGVVFDTPNTAGWDCMATFPDNFFFSTSHVASQIAVPNSIPTDLWSCRATTDQVNWVPQP